MLVSVGVVLLFGMLGIAADTLFGHPLGNVAPVGAHSAALDTVGIDQTAGSCGTSRLCEAAPSVLSSVTKNWASASRQTFLGFASVIGARGGSYSALWLAGVAAAALCMFCTRP